MSAATEPDTEAARLAPPPPGTVVWSMLAWPELLADFGWLEGRWAPLDAPDARDSVLTGHHTFLAAATGPGPPGARDCPGMHPRLRLADGPPPGVPLAALHAFVIL